MLTRQDVVNSRPDTRVIALHLRSSKHANMHSPILRVSAMCIRLVGLYCAPLPCQLVLTRVCAVTTGGGYVPQLRVPC